MIVTMLLGIAGALVGGFIGRTLWGSTGVNDWGIGSFALAIGGAILLLALPKAGPSGPAPPLRSGARIRTTSAGATSGLREVYGIAITDEVSF